MHLLRLAPRFPTLWDGPPHAGSSSARLARQAAAPRSPARFLCVAAAVVCPHLSLPAPLLPHAVWAMSAGRPTFAHQAASSSSSAFLNIHSSGLLVTFRRRRARLPNAPTAGSSQAQPTRLQYPPAPWTAVRRGIESRPGHRARQSGLARTRRRRPQARASCGPPHATAPPRGRRPWPWPPPPHHHQQYHP